MKKTKKGKIIFWIIFLVIGLIYYLQNEDFFMTEHKLGLNLYFYDFNPSPMPMLVYVVSFFFLGFLISFFFGFFEKLRTKKVIQDLTMKLDEQNKMLTSQKNEIERLRNVLREGDEINSEIAPQKESISESAGIGNKS